MKGKVRVALFAALILLATGAEDGANDQKLVRETGLVGYLVGSLVQVFESNVDSMKTNEIPIACSVVENSAWGAIEAYLNEAKSKSEKQIRKDAIYFMTLASASHHTIFNVHCSSVLKNLDRKTKNE